jgi:rod shape-determining protein MreD
LRGTADLLLLAVIAWALQKRVQTAWQWGIIAGLFVTVVSALPLGIGFANYVLAVGLALLLRQRIWQVPILAMFVATFFATLLTHTLSLVALRILGDPLPIWEALNLITLPSILLNLLLAVPAYALFSDLASWLYPEKLEA